MIASLVCRLMCRGGLGLAPASQRQKWDSGTLFLPPPRTGRVLAQSQSLVVLWFSGRAGKQGEDADSLTGSAVALGGQALNAAY